MSNTDGEATQRIEQTGEDYLRSIGENPDIMWSGDVYAIGAAFIAGQDSLREQLKQKGDSLEFFIDNTKLQAEMLKHQEETLKQQEEVIRELIPIAEKCLRTFQYDNLKINDFVNGIPSDQSDAVKAIIEKAKSLTTKDK